MTVADTQPAFPVARPPGSTPAWRRVPGFAAAKPSHLFLAGLLYVFFAIFLIWPVAQVVATGFRGTDGGFTLDYVRLIFSNPVYLRGLWNATVIAVLVTLLSLVIALPLAVLSVKYEFAGRGLMGGLMLVPLVLPPFVGALGIRHVLGTNGPLTEVLRIVGVDLPAGFDWLGRLQLTGIVVVEALHLYPILLLNLQAALANLDPAMEQAAANLGASRWTVFRRVTLPLIRPGLFAGATLVLVWSFTELGTPLMFDYNEVTPVQVYRQITDVADNPLPFALVVVMLAASVLLYLVGKFDPRPRLRRRDDQGLDRRDDPSKLTGGRAVLALLPFLLVFALAVLPHLSVILTSVAEAGQWYRSVLPTSLHRRPLRRRPDRRPRAAERRQLAALRRPRHPRRGGRRPRRRRRRRAIRRAGPRADRLARHAPARRARHRARLRLPVDQRRLPQPVPRRHHARQRRRLLRGRRQRPHRPRRHRLRCSGSTCRTTPPSC